MKKLIILMFLCLATACRQENDESNIRFRDPTGGGLGTTTTGNNKKKDSFYGFSDQGYMGQLPYIVADCPGDISEFNAAREVAHLLADSTTTWQSFDHWFDSGITRAAQQNLAIFILRNKGLIEAARQDPNDPGNQAALAKYINGLVETRYFGYSLLYAALQQCTDKAYVKYKAAEIMAYSVTETFHQNYLNNPSLSTDWRYQKVEDDLTYLAKIRELTE